MKISCNRMRKRNLLSTQYGTYLLLAGMKQVQVQAYAAQHLWWPESALQMLKQSDDPSW